MTGAWFDVYDKEPEYDRLSQSIHRDENGIKARSI